MTAVVRVETTGFDKVDRYLYTLGTKLRRNRSDATNYAVNNAAKVWSENFRSGGQMVGGWRGLSQRTQEERAAQGYGPDRPILRRSGALETVATQWPMTLRRSGSVVRGDKYSGELTKGLYRVRDGEGFLQVSGTKVLNQHGVGVLPQRQFWFVDNRVLRRSRDGVVLWIENEVLT